MSKPKKVETKPPVVVEQAPEEEFWGEIRPEWRHRVSGDPETTLFQWCKAHSESKTARKGEPGNPWRRSFKTEADRDAFEKFWNLVGYDERPEVKAFKRARTATSTKLNIKPDGTINFKEEIEWLKQQVTGQAPAQPQRLAQPGKDQSELVQAHQPQVVPVQGIL